MFFSIYWRRVEPLHSSSLPPSPPPPPALRRLRSLLIVAIIVLIGARWETSAGTACVFIVCVRARFHVCVRARLSVIQFTAD